MFATVRVVPSQPPLPVALEHGEAPAAADDAARSNKPAPIRHPRLPRNSTAKRAQGGRPQGDGCRDSDEQAALRRLLWSLGRKRPEASLQRHIGDLDWLAPVWVTVTGPTHQFSILPDPSGRAVINTAQHRPLILPVVQNFSNGQVDAPGAASLLGRSARSPPFPRPTRSLPGCQQCIGRGVRLRATRCGRAAALSRAAP